MLLSSIPICFVLFCIVVVCQFDWLRSIMVWMSSLNINTSIAPTAVSETLDSRGGTESSTQGDTGGVKIWCPYKRQSEWDFVRALFISIPCLQRMNNYAWQYRQLEIRE
ncbi:hypothetical protein EV421DRAFT_629425 [Armillaria borealis]|uniref:Uncharacterized protein n=1 Tax=Armillaria borealis TaxID=47425 RepID=A0AA39JFD3_9AGAR|nr:hypothetical protein EV421DRAFT_629425 [Armillaria borealis]